MGGRGGPLSLRAGLGEGRRESRRRPRGAESTRSFPPAHPQPGGSPPPFFLCLSWPFRDAGKRGARGWGLELGGTLPVLQRVGSGCPTCSLGQWWLLPSRLGRGVFGGGLEFPRG